jgi:hypothetical protein
MRAAQPGHPRRRQRFPGHPDHCRDRDYGRDGNRGDQKQLFDGRDDRRAAERQDRQRGAHGAVGARGSRRLRVARRAVAGRRRCSCAGTGRHAEEGLGRRW